MSFSLAGARKLRYLRRGVLLGGVLFISSCSLLADTRAVVGHQDSACYCHCAVSKARSGCAKMCEMPKYASRWWATSCARPKHNTTH